MLVPKLPDLPGVGTESYDRIVTMPERIREPWSFAPGRPLRSVTGLPEAAPNKIDRISVDAN